ncbi:sugar transferase [[Clostridium] hylemonae]|uniref:sugar transferase n=1 Tax=[Clostridium] hylemonae TaxID=89153 RepID=UPI001FCBD708|nr:sugar transferase [[Clostridium] hylemonae]BDF04161.1 glycosyl transferase [[Clostridium] hylemonae]
MKSWEKLPQFMQVEEVRPYYEILQRHKGSLLLKRFFDIIMAGALLIVLSPVFLILAFFIKADSKGPVMYRQTRVTTYGREFRIFKFRSMVQNADKKGSQVTTKCDRRITRIGRILRKYRLDELPQLLNILNGDMSFVGTRPEVVKYVRHYTSEMRATLLLPAGVTSMTSIEYKDEEKLLESVEDADDIYIHQILPEKMKYNLKALEKFNFLEDLKTMFRTVLAVLK